MKYAAFLALSLAVQQPEAEAPVEKRGLTVHEDGAFPGYTLIAPIKSTDVHLIDMDGELVHTWKTDLAPGAWSYLLENGHLVRCGRLEDNPRFNGGGIGGRIQELDWDGNVVWEHDIASDYQTQHHDIEPMPNGNLLVIVWENRFPEDAVEWGRDPRQVGEKGFWTDAVLELRPTRPKGAEVVWEWHAWDHVVQDFDEDKETYGYVADRPERIDLNFDHRDRAPETPEQRKKRLELERQMRSIGYAGDDDEDEDEPDDARGRPKPGDWLHTNSVDYNPEYDLIVLSSPHMSEIFVIDHSPPTADAAWGEGGRWKKGGDLLYRWGNPKNYGVGDDGDRHLFYQHDPSWIPGEKPGELRLLVYNNGQGRTGGENDYSSVEELVLPFDPKKGFVREKGQAYGPAEPAWVYESPGEFYSAFISGAQRLPNGNTLVCEGAPGRVFEVTREGKIVWEYKNPYGGEVKASNVAPDTPPHSLFRATRVSLDYPGVKGRL